MEFNELYSALRRGIYDLLTDPQKAHAAAVHLPVAIAVLGALGTLLLLFSGGKWRGMRWALVVMYAAGMLFGWLADETGHRAEAMLSQRGPTLDGTAEELLKQHVALGEWVWIPMGITLLALCFVGGKKSGPRVLMAVIALVAALGTNAYIAVVATKGGALVYEHGVGVPASTNNLTKPLPVEKPPKLDPVAPPTKKSGDGDATGSTGDDKTGDDATGKKTDDAGKNSKGDGKVDPGPQLPGPPLFD